MYQSWSERTVKFFSRELRHVRRDQPWLNISWSRRSLLMETLGDVGLARGDGDQVVVQGDGLVQPLPRLVQGVDAVPDTQTISTVLLHSSVCWQFESQVKSSRAGSSKFPRDTCASVDARVVTTAAFYTLDTNNLPRVPRRLHDANVWSILESANAEWDALSEFRFYIKTTYKRHSSARDKGKERGSRLATRRGYLGSRHKVQLIDAWCKQRDTTIRLSSSIPLLIPTRDRISGA